nr:reverse transcriptase domain-containing protein [Tanacetum cinerariifolium]
MEYLAKISKKARILELKRRYFEQYCSDNQYVVSIKEDTTYLCLHFTKEHEGNNFNTLYPEKTNTPYWSSTGPVGTPGQKTTLPHTFATRTLTTLLPVLGIWIQDNNCTIEFDAFGFSVKDFVTRQSSGSLDFEVLMVGYEHVVMNCVSAGIRKGSACDRDMRMLIPFCGCLLARGSQNDMFVLYAIPIESFTAPFTISTLRIIAFTFKSLLSNKEKLFELANTLLTENCSAVLLKKLPKKLKDPGRFLIPCEFQGLESYMALADLGASINLMPLFVWKKLSLSELTPTRITLELATRSIAYPAGIAEDVFMQVGKFTFPDDFVVVDYDVDPRGPLILGRPFLRTAYALVDVHGEELILRDGDEQLIFHADSTSKHPYKHGNESVNKINFIDITCEDRFPEVLKFKKLNHPSSGSTTPLSDSSPSLTPFETSDSLLEEFTDELALLDPFPPLLTSGSTLPKESAELFEIASLPSSPFINEDKGNRLLIPEGLLPLSRSSAPAIATVTTMTVEIDADATAARAPIAPCLFGVGSSSTGRTHSVPFGFSDVFGSDSLIGGIRTVVDPESDLQKVYLFTEFNVGAARQISLNDEVRMRAEYNIREKRKLRAVVDE